MQKVKPFERQQLALFTLVIILFFCPYLHGEQPKYENRENIHKSSILWNGEESVRDYAARLGIPAEFVLESTGLRIEMVLIPAGRFHMGILKPVPLPIYMPTGLIVSAICLIIIIAVSGRVFWIAKIRNGKPQFSLRSYILIIFALSVLMGGIIYDYLARKANAQFYAAALRYDDSLEEERVAHEVTISAPFYLSRCEITEGDFLLDKNQYTGSRQPATNISWYDASAYCERLSGILKLDVRLPTEAWEFACRAGTTTEYHCGDQFAALDLCGWYEKNSGYKVQLVGKKKMNQFGLYDMHGNVSEWCADWFQEYSSDSVVDPKGPKSGSEKIIRGGSVASPSIGCKSYSRNMGAPFVFSEFFGFRIAVSVPATQ